MSTKDLPWVPERAATVSFQRTGDRNCSTSALRISSAVRTGAAVVGDQTSTCGSEKVTSSSAERIGSIAGSITGEWNAAENAQEMIGDLTLEMNRVRQAEITQEILEVVAGAEALG